tara:strand:+ start:301 stop:894 length:594 start_codon:yes stop_codon:yes gene_type:complete
MSKAILIGNGPSALEYKMGNLIDSNEFDSVFRFNRGHKQDNGAPNIGFKEYVGTRCDYWVVSDLRINLAIKRYNEYSGIFIVTPKFKWDNERFNKININYPNIQFIPPAYEEDINKIIDFSPKWPSTGVVGIHAISNLFDEVYIYGFDTYDIKYDTHHYFEDKPNKYKLSQGNDHNPSKEKFYIKHMLENKKIKLLK